MSWFRCSEKPCMISWRLRGGLPAAFLAMAAVFAQAQVLEHIRLPTEAEVTDVELHVVVDEALAAEIAGLAEQLGSLRYAERDGAAQRLREIGVPAFAILRDRYRSTDDVEVRLSIERIVHEAYLNEYVYNRCGFLGISQDTQRFITPTDDARVGQGNVGVRIYRVHEGTAAAAAGLQSGDVVIAFDGAPIPASAEPWRDFGDRIRRAGPHATVVLTILRGSLQRDVDVTLGRCPANMVQAGSIQAVTPQWIETTVRFQIWWAKFFREEAAPAEAMP